MNLPRPIAGPGELLVAITAAGMNPFDAKVLEGILKERPHKFPLVAGVDAAGVVDAVGPGVERFRPGDRIYGQFLHTPVGRGTYAEYTTVPENVGVARIPDGLSDIQAAAIPTAGMTAYDALERLAVGSRSTLAIVGASGGIGSFAVPLASARGARVIGVARVGAARRLRTLGAHELQDVASPGWVEAVRGEHPDGIDALLDLMSDRAGFARALTLLHPGGRGATTVYAADPARTPPGVTAVTIDLQPSVELLERVTAELARHHLEVAVERTIPLERAPEALAEMRAGRSSGKTVIVL